MKPEKDEEKIKKLEEMYDVAAHERFSFLYVNLLASTKEDMFFKTFEYRMHV